MAENQSNPATGARSYRSPAVEKAIDVIERLAASADGESAKTVAEAMDRTISEIYRVLGSLEGRGVIRKAPGSDRYTLSMWAFQLAHRHPPTGRLVSLAQPITDALSLSTMQSCHLGTAEGDRLHILVSAPSPLQMYYAVKVGSAFPLLETSSGVILVADMEDGAIASFIAEAAATARKGLRERLRKAGENGYEVHDSRIVPGIKNMSAPVRDSTGRVRAAMTIPYLAQTRATVTENQALSQLVDAARLLGARLGHIQKEGARYGLGA